jgi:long-chain acyl-CoA synthetase
VKDLKEMTDTACAKFADHDAYRIMEGPSEYASISYARFGQDICALANALIDKGLSGKRIAVVGENSYPWVLAYLSTVNINATIVTLDKELPQEAMLDQVSRADVCTLFFSNSYSEEAAYIKANIPGITLVSFKEGADAEFTVPGLIKRGGELIAQGKDRYSGIQIDRERTCAILFTSGTTGGSKGVMLSHHNLASNLVSVCEVILYKPEDVLLSVLPIHHTFESMGTMLGAINHGATVAFCESIKYLPAALKLFTPSVITLVPLYIEKFYRRIWDAARKQGKDGKLKLGIALCNILAAIGINVRGKVLADVLDFFGGRLRKIPCGGAPLDPTLYKKYKGFGITILHGYGTTECSPIIAGNNDSRQKGGTDGILMSCCEVRFSEEGEILIKGTNVMKGYLDDEKATAEVFDGEWYRTGDLGYMDKDGFIHVIGRCKNLIVLKNGKNVSPEEIEYKLSAVPYVAEVLVMENPENEFLVAQIYPDQEALKTLGEETLRREISNGIDSVNRKLESYKKVRRFELRSTEFPKTTKKSIMRYRVKG